MNWSVTRTGTKVPEDEALRRSMAQYLEHRVERLADVVSSVLGMSDLPGINDGPAIRPDL